MPSIFFVRGSSCRDPTGVGKCPACSHHPPIKVTSSPRSIWRWCPKSLKKGHLWYVSTHAQVFNISNFLEVTFIELACEEVTKNAWTSTFFHGERRHPLGVPWWHPPSGTWSASSISKPRRKLLGIDGLDSACEEPTRDRFGHDNGVEATNKKVGDEFLWSKVGCKKSRLVFRQSLNYSLDFNTTCEFSSALVGRKSRQLGPHPWVKPDMVDVSMIGESLGSYFGLPSGYVKITMEAMAIEISGVFPSKKCYFP